MKDVSADRQHSADSARMMVWGRFARAYALDLAASLVLVLLAARIWGMIAGTSPDNPWVYQLQTAMTRFTPLGLWDIYSDQLRTAVVETTSNPGSSIASNMLLGLRLLYDLLYAGCQTAGTVWQQTETVSDWMTLVGFTGILLVSLVVLATGGGRLSLVRLLLAVVAGPLATISLFWIAQQTALDVLNGFAAYAAAAPWCLLCPVACTLYWVAFPGADHSATVTCIEALRRLRLPMSRRRGIADGVSTVPLTRHK